MKEYTWYIPESAKIVKIGSISVKNWNVKALNLKWSH